MAKIKLATQGDVPRFVHNGLNISQNWQEVDLDTMTDETRQALVDYVGRFVRVHDDDLDAFKAYLSQHGLEYTDEGHVRDPAAEERKRQEEARAAQPGQQPAPTSQPASADQGNFQTPPGAISGRVVEPDTSGGTRDTVTRDRDTTTTDPQKPSNLAKGTAVPPKDRGR